MCHAGIHQHRVERAADWSGRIGVPQVHLRIAGEIAMRRARERIVDFVRDDAPVGADAFGHDGRVVAEAGADVQYAHAGREPQVIHPHAERSRLPVEQVPRGIDRHGDVVVDARGIRVRRRAISLRTAAHLVRHVAVGEDGPRAGGQEALARHGRERIHQIRRSQLHDGLDLLGKETPPLFEIQILRRHACLALF